MTCKKIFEKNNAIKKDKGHFLSFLSELVYVYIYSNNVYMCYVICLEEIPLLEESNRDTKDLTRFHKVLRYKVFMILLYGIPPGQC